MKRNGWRLYSYMGVWYRFRGREFDYLDSDGKWYQRDRERIGLLVQRLGREH